MPLRWKRGSNPFVDNAFGVLQIGSLASPAYIAACSDNLAKAAADPHAIAQAAKALRDPATRAEEQLLAHPQVQRDAKRPLRLARQIDEVAVLPPERDTPALRDPLAIFWFTPAPTASAAPKPGWDKLGLAAIGAPEDLALDIVFDT